MPKFMSSHGKKTRFINACEELRRQCWLHMSIAITGVTNRQKILLVRPKTP